MGQAVNPALVELARDYRLVASVVDNGRVGGCGAALVQALTDAGVEAPTMVFGIPPEFLEHGKRAGILDAVGLGAQSLSRDITARVSGLEPAPRPGVSTGTSGT